MIRFTAGCLLAFGLVSPGLVFLAATGDLTLYVREPVPPGQALYVLAKLAGLYAITLIWLQLVLGALRPLLRFRFSGARLLRLHRILGPLSLALVVLHVGFYASAVALRSSSGFPWSLFAPDLSGPFYSRMLSLGIAALVLALVAGASAALRRVAIFKPTWKKLHLLNYVVFALALLHSFAIGSETREPPLLILYAIFLITWLGSVVTAIVLRSVRQPSTA